MTLEAGPLVLTAKFVFPIAGDPIEDGVVTLNEGRIESVGKAAPVLDGSDSRTRSYRRIDYGDCAILPGLINLHSHLDYSALRFANSNLSLFDWIPALMTSVSKWSPEDFLQSAMYGARLLALNGISTVVDSSYTGQSAEALAAAGIKGIVGLELFGVDESKSDLAWSAWLAKMESRRDNASPALQAALDRERIRLTVAPHAPYTVNPRLWSKARDWAQSRNLPVLAHLAESHAECLWIAGSSTQEIDEYLIKVMPATPQTDTRSLLESINWKGHGQSPVAHLKANGLLDANLLAAHCVHVDDRDLELLEQSDVAIAHCPRSNARLQNGRAPFERFIAAGLRVGLGTDSLASCDDLSLLGEARFALNLHRCRPEASKQGSVNGKLPTSREMLARITLDAARAIGMEHEIGSIEPGKRADLAVFRLHTDHTLAAPTKKSASIDVNTPGFAHNNYPIPEDVIIRSPSSLEDLFVDGRRIVTGGRLRKSEGMAADTKMY